MSTDASTLYDVFICYRRDKDAETAKRLQDILAGKGYRVFCESDPFSSGEFNRELLGIIERCTDFLMILSPGALDRDDNIDEWIRVRMELSCAMRGKKNVIALTDDHFVYPEELPEDILSLREKKQLRFVPVNFDAVVKDLLPSLQSKAASRRPKIIPIAATLATVVVLAVLAAALWKGGVFRPQDTDAPHPDASAQPETETAESQEPEPSSGNGLLTGALNVMKEDGIYQSNPPEDYDYTSHTVFGSRLLRKQIGSVTFLDSLADRPADAMDISQSQNGTVMAWAAENSSSLYDLYIGAEGGVIAPEDCTALFIGYCNAERIEFNRHFDTRNVTTMADMFYGCEKLKELDLEGFDTSRVTNMKYMFWQCKELQKLNVSGFNTANVTNMRGIFGKCYALTALDVSSFSTEKAENMRAMFQECKSLTALDVNRFNTSSATDMSYMFLGCAALRAIDVSGFDTRNVTSLEGMFEGCGQLTAVDVSGFDTSGVTTMAMLFQNCDHLKEVDVSRFNTERAEKLYSMFRNTACETIRLGRFDTSNATEMYDVFDSCDSLTDVYYAGTQEQWQASGLAEQLPGTATVHFGG